MIPQIRVACRYCDTDRGDGLTEVPADWLDVEEVQSFTASRQPIPADDRARSPFEWYTHLGTCPDCRKVHG